MIEERKGISLTVSTPQQPPLQNPRRHWFLQHPISMLTLSIVITVIVIAGLIYPMRSGPIDDDTPHGKLDFTENEAGLTGSFYQLTENVRIKDVGFSIMDKSEEATASLEPLVSREVIQVPRGLNATYIDHNGNKILDGADTIRAQNHDKGDTFTFTYIPTGGIITKYTVIG